tara:strand:- start:600 stop:740 length:141 start_codon:yes stop_codon:yes gene_type:complete
MGTIFKCGMKVGAGMVVGATSYANKSADHNLVAYGSQCKKLELGKK